MPATQDGAKWLAVKPSVEPKRPNGPVAYQNKIEAARARLDAYGAAVQLKRTGTWLVGRCPFHADRNPSFAVRNGRWTCFAGCGGGDVINFVMRLRGMSFGDAVASLAGVSPIPLISRRFGQRLIPPARDNGADAEAVADAKSRAKLARALWRAADDERLALFYLQMRGLRGIVPDAIRGHRTVWCTESRRRRPAVLAAITNGHGVVLAVQRIWCETRLEFDGSTEYPKGSRSSDLKAGKKTLGDMRDGAVRLAPAGPILGICEGVETALHCHEAFRLPVWAACGANRLGAITVPDGVKQIIVFGDNGQIDKPDSRKASWAAAEKAATDYSRRGYAASAQFPDPGYDDFEDQRRAR